jgi:hypothetical protein
MSVGRVSSLEGHVSALEKKMAKAEAEIDELKKKMAVLEANDQRVTVREICTAVERKLCLEAAGSMAKMKNGYYCFSLFESKPVEKAQLDSVLSKYQVSSTLIGYLKEHGGNVTHDNWTVPLLESAILDNDDDADAVSEKEKLVRALYALGMVKSDGSIFVK